MTGGWLKWQAEKTALTEMSVNNGRWEIVSSASLSAPLIAPAALTINNQVYLFGNSSKPRRFKINHCYAGGSSDKLNSFTVNLNQILKFDSYQNSWIAGGAMRYPRYPRPTVQVLPNVSRFCWQSPAPLPPPPIPTPPPLTPSKPVCWFLGICHTCLSAILWL